MRGDLNYIIQNEKLGGLDISEFTASLEVIFAVIDTWAEMTSKGAKAIFEAEVITHKKELYARLSKMEKQREDPVDIVSFVEEAKVVAMTKIENVVHHMETLRKKLGKVEAKFNELK